MIKINIDEETVLIDLKKIKYEDFLILKTHNFNTNNNIHEMQTYSNNFEIFTEFILKIAYQENIDATKINIDNISFINLDLKYFGLPSLLDIEDKYIARITSILKMFFVKYLGDDSIYDNYVIDKISFKKYEYGIINAFLPNFTSKEELYLMMDLNKKSINKNNVTVNNKRCVLNLYGSNGKNFYSESKFTINHLFFKKVDKKIYIGKIEIVEILDEKKIDHVYDGKQNGFFGILISNIIYEIIRTNDVYLEIEKFKRYAWDEGGRFTDYFCISDVIVEMKII